MTVLILIEFVGKWHTRTKLYFEAQKIIFFFTFAHSQEGVFTIFLWLDCVCLYEYELVHIQRQKRRFCYKETGLYVKGRNFTLSSKHCYIIKQWSVIRKGGFLLKISLLVESCRAKVTPISHRKRQFSLCFGLAVVYSSSLFDK